VARRFCASRRGERRSPQGRTPFGPTCWLRLCRAVAIVPNFFVSCEEFLRSSLGPGWLELPIVDCRLLMHIGRSCNTTFSIVNRQSAIGNENLVFGCGRRPRCYNWLLLWPEVVPIRGQVSYEGSLEVFVNHLRSLACAFLLAGTCFAIPSAPDTPDQAAINEAVDWIRTTPRIRAEYDYIMTCRLRLLFFGVGRDDLGGGYIKTGQAVDDPSLQMIQLLFGSDPAKAPRAINRWGAGTEVLRSDGSKTPQSSAFVGFMKSSKGESV